MTKELVLAKVDEALRVKISQLESDLSALQTAMGEDSKSSAGDKYETSREMIQQEIEKLAQQLAEQRRLLNTNVQFSQQLLHTSVAAGSLVETSESILLIGLPIGKITVLENTTVFGVGASAPFVQLLLGKSAGENVSFQGRSIRIISVS